MSSPPSNVLQVSPPSFVVVPILLLLFLLLLRPPPHPSPMDYDRYDATLHYIFKQTQGDAWFRPHEDQVPPGVCLRTHDGSFRVFPYETAALAPFEAAVSALNPHVAVKVRSAAVHAALAEQSLEPDYIYVDSNTRIQVLDSMFLLPQAEKDQNAAFIVRLLSFFLSFPFYLSSTARRTSPRRMERLP